MAIVSDYLHEIRAIRGTGAATPETAFYPPVDRMFNAIGEKLKPKVGFVTQLRNQSAGMPDGGFFLQRGRSAGPPVARNPDFGAVEIKPARWNLDELTRDEQTARYLKQYGAVLLTNLREFRLLVRNADGTDGRPRTLERYVLAVTEDELWYGKTDGKHNELLLDFLRRVMLYKVPLSEPKQVAWLLASYAREAGAGRGARPSGVPQREAGVGGVAGDRVRGREGRAVLPVDAGADAVLWHLLGVGAVAALASKMQTLK